MKYIQQRGKRMRKTHFDVLMEQLSSADKRVIDIANWNDQRLIYFFNAMQHQTLTDPDVEPDKLKRRKSFNSPGAMGGFYAALASFVTAGKKVFTLKPDLAYLLYFTTIEKVDAKNIQVPFPCFYLNGFENLNFKTEDQINTISAIYVRGTIPMEEEREYLFKQHEDCLVPSCKSPEDIIYSLNFIFTTNDFTEKGKEDFFSVPFPLTVGDTLEQVSYFLEHYGALFFSDYNIDLISRMVKFALNCLLYINSEEAIIKNITPKAVTQKKSARRSYSRNRIKHIPKRTAVTHYSVGSNITLSPADRQTYGDACATNTKHVATWVVRGHWHGYWKRKENISKADRVTGSEGDKILIKKFIQPYIKGNKDMAPLHKDYTVK